MISLSFLHFFGLWKEAGISGENPCRSRENMQTPHRKALCKIWSTLTNECSYKCMILYSKQGGPVLRNTALQQRPSDMKSQCCALTHHSTLRTLIFGPVPFLLKTWRLFYFFCTSMETAQSWIESKRRTQTLVMYNSMNH